MDYSKKSKLFLKILIFRCTAAIAVYAQLGRFARYMRNLIWKLFPGNPVDRAIERKLSADALELYGKYLEAEPENKKTAYSKYKNADSSYRSQLKSI